MTYDTHEDSPENNNTHNRHGGGVGGEGLGQRRKNDDDQLQTIHPFTADDICKSSKNNLADNSSAGCSNLPRGQINRFPFHSFKPNSP